MKKIIIIGSSGAGKSTLSRQLAEKLEIELFHLDNLFWKPGWNLIDQEEQLLIQEKLVQKEAWIIDGNYGNSLELRVKAADTIIFLDLPRTICTYQVIKRVLQNINTTRPDMGKDCPERLDWSFFKWTWDFPKNQRPRIINALSSISSDQQILRLTSKKDIKEWVDSL